MLNEYAAVFRTDTFRRWYRRLVTMQVDSSEKRKGKGRPKTSKKVQQLILRVARENSRWGYGKIRGMLKLNGHGVLFQVS